MKTATTRTQGELKVYHTEHAGRSQFTRTLYENNKRVLDLDFSRINTLNEAQELQNKIVNSLNNYDAILNALKKADDFLTEFCRIPHIEKTENELFLKSISHLLVIEEAIKKAEQIN